MAIEGLMWDMGKVIIDFDIPAQNRVLAAHCRKTEQEINAILYGSSGKDRTYNKGLVGSLNKGDESFEEFYWKVRKVLDIDMGLEEFEQLWRNVLTEPREKIIRFIHKLHSQGYPQCIVSSTNHIQWDEMNRRSGIDDLKTIEELLGSEHIVTTYKVHATKESGMPLEEGRRKLGCPPKEHVVYIDDVMEYVSSACLSQGYQGVFFDNNNFNAQENCINRLLQLGIKA